MATDAAPDQETLFRQLESHPWPTDASFQAGLSAILGSQAGPSLSTSNAQVPAVDSPQTSPQTHELKLHARVFYYMRIHSLPPGSVDFAAYKAWRARQAPEMLTPLELASPLPPISAPDTPERRDGSEGASRNVSGQASVNGTPTKGSKATADGSSSAAAGPQQPEYPASFQQIMELIQKGEPIPGIVDIPDTVLEGQGSQPSKTARLKPWEKNTEAQQQTT